MNTNFEKWSIPLRNSFAKDYSLPTSMPIDPYFTYQVNFLDRQYKTLDKALLLNNALNNFGNESNLSEEIKKFRLNMILYIQKHKDYEMFQYLTMSYPDEFPEGTLYKDELCNKKLISIDLVSANFQSVKFAFPDIVNNSKNYYEFAKHFTDEEYFLNSKRLRQIIFGSLLPKKQQIIQRVIISNICNIFSSFPEIKPVSLSSDEIIFESTYDKDFFVKQLSESQFELKIEEFTIERVPTKNADIFIKKFPDGKFSLKCCPSHYVLEVLKHLYNEPINPYDVTFMHEERICEYKDRLF